MAGAGGHGKMIPLYDHMRQGSTRALQFLQLLLGWRYCSAIPFVCLLLGNLVGT